MNPLSPTVPLPSTAAVPTYSPLGKPVVGNESAQEKDRALPPVEQGAAGEKARNRVESKPENETGHRQPQPGESPQTAADGSDEAEANGAQPMAAGTGVPAIRVVPDGHAEPAHGRAALDAFNQPAADRGQLLDQRV